MSNLPKHSFPDVPSDVLRELREEIAARGPQPDLEEMEEWYRREKPAPPCEWREPVGEFLSDVRYEHHA